MPRANPPWCARCGTTPATAGQALDAGACCVISPMVNTRAQAEALVRSAKYPPMGARSWGGYTALQASGLPPAEYLKQSNQMTMVFAMVETVEALSNLDEIAATPGLDGLFVGPSDLSITLSKGAGIDKLGKDTLAAMAKVVGGLQEERSGRGCLRRQFGCDQGLHQARLHLHRRGGRRRPAAVGSGRSPQVPRGLTARPIRVTVHHHGSACPPHSGP